MCLFKNQLPILLRLFRIEVGGERLYGRQWVRDSLAAMEVGWLGVGSRRAISIRRKVSN